MLNNKNSKNIDSRFSFAKKIIEKASKLVLKNYKKVEKISFKRSFYDLVTNVDKEVENFILKEITKKFPTHTIITEETGLHKKSPDHVWFIDPIDGTTNFAHGYPFFCISIAYAQDGIIEFGLVQSPITKETYSAKKNKGAKLNGKPIKVSKAKKLNASLLATGFPYDRQKSKINNLKNFCNLTLRTQGVRRDGAAALDLCYVASGKIDGFWELKLSPWDVAAGVLIINEAGGKVTDFKGNKFNILDKDIVASNGLIHKELLRHLKWVVILSASEGSYYVMRSFT